MGRKTKIRYITDIKSLRELREVRQKLEVKAWYAEQRLMDKAGETFSIENIISVIAPPGSAADRIVGSVANGFATVRGILNGLRVFRGSR